MIRFDEQAVYGAIQEVVDLRPKIEDAVDRLCEKGFQNLFILGIGGTYAAGMQLMAYLKGHSGMEVHLENAADLTAIGNRRLTEKSVVVTASATGNTPEVVEAVRYVQDRGAAVVGFIDEADSPLAKASDILLQAKGGTYPKLLLFFLRMMKNQGEFYGYDTFCEQLKNLPQGIVQVQKDADGKAAEYAEKYCDEPLHYVIGGGNLWGSAYSYAMCYMEEMLWMRTKSVSASEFFHGTLEVVERDTPVLLFMGEDEARKQTDRVYAFLQRICAKISVFDTRDYPLPGIDEAYRGLLSPIILAAVYSRINAHLEHELRHPMDIRRYYRCLEY